MRCSTCAALSVQNTKLAPRCALVSTTDRWDTRSGESHLEVFGRFGEVCVFERDGFYRVAADSRRGRWFWIALSNAGMVWTTRAPAMQSCTTFMRFWR